MIRSIQVTEKCIHHLNGETKMTKIGYISTVLLSALMIAVPAYATTESNDVHVTITIKDHHFEPSEIKVPAGQKIKLTVKNLDSTAEEFESSDLHREKVIAGGKEAVITLRPLDKGSYKFVGEFHEETAHGIIIAE
jgi:plastocyanin